MRRTVLFPILILSLAGCADIDAPEPELALVAQAEVVDDRIPVGHFCSIFSECGEALSCLVPRTTGIEDPLVVTESGYGDTVEPEAGLCMPRPHCRQMVTRVSCEDGRIQVTGRTRRAYAGQMIGIEVNGMVRDVTVRDNGRFGASVRADSTRNLAGVLGCRHSIEAVLCSGYSD